MFAVQGVVQPYAWGPTGTDNAVSFFAQRQNLTVEVSAHKAELWLGAHPSASAMAAKVEAVTDESRKRESELRQLSKVLAGQKLNIPFLLKVLSVDCALSIQMHPDQVIAAKLHARDPEHYKDPYDKPEMCIPLSSSFELLCGFLKAREICVLAEAVPFLGTLLRKISASTDARKDPSTLVQLIGEPAFYKALLTAFYAESQADITAALEETNEVDPSQVDIKAIRKVHKNNTSVLRGVVSALTGTSTAVAEYYDLINDCFSTFKYLYRNFPSDRGCFAAFFLAKHTLLEGQPFVIPPNTLHAYLKGECLEIMKTSDNVVRAGLTSKYRDVDTLLAYMACTRFKLAPFAHSRILGDKNSDEKFTLDVYTPKCTESFRIALLSIVGGCTSQIDIAKHLPILKHDKDKLEVREVLCVCGIGELTIDGERHKIEGGACILLTSKTLEKISALSESAVDGYLKHGNALTLVFAWGTADLEPMRRTSVTASALIETAPSSVNTKISDEPVTNEPALD